MTALPLPQLLLLFLLVSFSAGFINHGRPPIVRSSPVAIARDFQNALNNAIQYRKRVNVMMSMSPRFKYEGCGGNMDRTKFGDWLLASEASGHVTEARADGQHVIYKMIFGTKRIEAMITKMGAARVLTRAQELIC